MERYTVTLAPSGLQTRMLLMHGPDELMRALLPPPAAVRHERSAPTLLQGLALWLDARVHAVLSVAEKDAGFCLGLTDEMGCGQGNLFYDVEVVERGARRRGQRIRGVGDFADLRQLEMHVQARGGR